MGSCRPRSHRHELRLDTLATCIDVGGRRLAVREQDGSEALIDYDELIVGTGALPARPPIEGLDTLGADDGVRFEQLICRA